MVEFVPPLSSQRCRHHRTLGKKPLQKDERDRGQPSSHAHHAWKTEQQGTATTVSSWQTLILIAKMRQRSPVMSLEGAAVGTQTECETMLRLDALVC